MPGREQEEALIALVQAVEDLVDLDLINNGLRKHRSETRATLVAAADRDDPSGTAAGGPSP